MAIITKKQKYKTKIIRILVYRERVVSIWVVLNIAYINIYILFCLMQKPASFLLCSLNLLTTKTVQKGSIYKIIGLFVNDTYFLLIIKLYLKALQKLF